MKTKTSVATLTGSQAVATVGSTAMAVVAKTVGDAVALALAGQNLVPVQAEPKLKRITQNRLDLFLDAKALVKAEGAALKKALEAGAEIEEGACDAAVVGEPDRDINFRDLAVELADILVSAGMIKKIEDGEAYVKERVSEAPYKTPTPQRLKVWRDE